MVAQEGTGVRGVVRLGLVMGSPAPACAGCRQEFGENDAFGIGVEVRPGKILWEWICWVCVIERLLDEVEARNRKPRKEEIDGKGSGAEDGIVACDSGFLPRMRGGSTGGG